MQARGPAVHVLRPFARLIAQHLLKLVCVENITADDVPVPYPQTVVLQRKVPARLSLLQCALGQLVIILSLDLFRHILHRSD